MDASFITARRCGERSLHNKRLVCALLLSTACGMPQTAMAIPIFGQRYQLRCDACHSVLPELNTFGTQFRASGYRLPIPKHGTTGLAIRYQLEYEKDHHVLRQPFVQRNHPNYLTPSQ